MGLLAKASVAIDGSKFKAVNNRDKNLHRGQAREAAQTVGGERCALSRAARNRRSAGRVGDDRAEKDAISRTKLEKLKSEMGKLEAIEKQVLASPDKQLSLTDPDSRSMATSGRGSGVVGYNVQTAVDTEHHLIVHHEVTNIGNDTAHLANYCQGDEGRARCRRSRSGGRSRLLRQRGDQGVR